MGKPMQIHRKGNAWRVDDFFVFVKIPTPSPKGKIKKLPLFLDGRSITAADPTGLGGRYRTGNTITVVFSESTNRGGFGYTPQDRKSVV